MYAFEAVERINKIDELINLLSVRRTEGVITSKEVEEITQEYQEEKRTLVDALYNTKLIFEE
ncbi:hypothetical protein [Siminovitchia sp. 179-K 8D1 HS]|uniref:hypothetical protein n=1 Tax=Siminovitchia sp. 179-K 8D1 HS TaxID=3142385 RepID=UPI00399FD645